MSAFTPLSQDTLQHEINLFLDPVSRASWNTLLDPTERVYKKFPKDYALKVSLKASSKNFNMHMRNVSDAVLNLRSIYDNPLEALFAENAFLKNIMKLFAFVSTPVGLNLIEYKRGLKEDLLNYLNTWIDMTYGVEYWWDELCDSKKYSPYTQRPK